MDSRPYSRFQLAKKYLRYWLHADNGKGHGIHSPFVYAFVREVLMEIDFSQPLASREIEKLRKRLLSDNSVLQVEDWGAGSTQQGRQRERRVSDIAKHAAKSSRWGALLHRSVAYFQPKGIVELGTSLGLSGAYLASARFGAPFYTIEGSPKVAERARQHFKELGMTDVEVVTGQFDNCLPQLLPQLPKPFFAYVDGNHQEEPTINYFHQLKANADADTVLVFDDIHWSAGMEAAWETIKNDPAVTCTIDLFFVGFVFFRPGIRPARHFTIRY
ncbi:O-methyltransferase [Flavihumibacter petaseus]|uniref:Putative methyltransferase n=1 Tax=Flavihumibacter petaseus NBRC 106054 TaxID=1220578 RepID=A0A0E9MZ02_9BACT|nr:class I SAM-dependent methyltransferase [Flavihumibacter petaseus]GAO42942.1 putative methyltransferase [Flavihumibacter petaseus NBRC 106054]